MAVLHSVKILLQYRIDLNLRNEMFENRSLIWTLSENPPK